MTHRYPCPFEVFSHLNSINRLELVPLPTQANYFYNYTKQHSILAPTKPIFLHTTCADSRALVYINILAIFLLKAFYNTTCADTRTLIYINILAIEKIFALL